MIEAYSKDEKIIETNPNKTDKVLANSRVSNERDVHWPSVSFDGHQGIQTADSIRFFEFPDVTSSSNASVGTCGRRLFLAVRFTSVVTNDVGA
jgi:hypothetical protein